MIHHTKRIMNLIGGTAVSAFLTLSAVQTNAQIDPCSQTTKLSGGTTFNRDGRGDVAGGYHYELWHDGGGAMNMTVYGKGAAFKADWNNAGDFLARVGLAWNSTQTHDKYANIVADYAFTKTGSGGGYSFIGIYGWTKDPLIEYYIVEDWYGTNPPTGGGQLMGSFEVDGGTYKIYKFQRVNKPSIIGNTTFWQFFSVRQKARNCGHISLTEHFKKWASLNLTMGKMYEAKILVEAGGGQGTFDLTYATMQANVPPTAVRQDMPQISRMGGAAWANGKSGVLSLISLDSSVVRSVRQTVSNPAIIPTNNLPSGLYVMKFQAAGCAPQMQKLLLE
jgi:hypothetical protein